MTTSTTNYGWIKPDVGASDDVWGGQLNTDLDGIDSTVKSVSTVAAAAQTSSQVDAKIAAATGAYLPLAGGTLTGMLLGTTAAFSGATSGASFTGSAVVVSGAAGSSRSYWGQTTGSNRWAMNLGDTAAESTGNAGSNFVLYRFSDAGSFIDAPLTVERKTGIITIPNLSAPQAIGDNRIINGNFAINQRIYVTSTVLAAAAYGHDRWKAGPSGCTYTFTAALPDTTITITANTLTQVIEAGMIEGGVYTLSWTGTAQARVYQGAPTGSYAASPIATASLTAGTNTIVEFNAGTLTRVKLETGSVATPYNRQSLAQSLIDCQRYYQVNGYLYGFAATATAISVLWPYQVQMRAAATLALLTTTVGGESPPLAAAKPGSSSAISSSHVANSLSAIDFTVTGFTGLTVNAPASITPGQISASAEL